jgi:hypothetical protein
MKLLYAFFRVVQAERKLPAYTTYNDGTDGVFRNIGI